jgi:ABC-2 type transport system permease protein
VYLLDPIAAIITAYRCMLLQPISPSAFNASLKGAKPLPFDWTLWFGACLLSFLIAWAGYAYFNRRKWLFVERP